jgi:hypothetical protein
MSFYSPVIIYWHFTNQKTTLGNNGLPDGLFIPDRLKSDGETVSGKYRQYQHDWIRFKVNGEMPHQKSDGFTRASQRRFSSKVLSAQQW